MNIKQLYADNLLGSAFGRLYAGRAAVGIEGPEILPYRVAANWLAMNYLWALGFDGQGTPVLGEMGGTVPVLEGIMNGILLSDSLPKKPLSRGPKDPSAPKRPTRAIAVAVGCFAPVIYETTRMAGNHYISLEPALPHSDVETDVRQNGDGRVRVLRANRDIGKYDVMSGVVIDETLDGLLAAHEPIYLATLAVEQSWTLFFGSYAQQFPCKQLLHEYYVLHVPVHWKLIGQLQGTINTGFHNALEAIASFGTELVPQEFLAGFHVRYNQNGLQVSIRPLIPAQNHDPGTLESLREFGVSPIDSRVMALGLGSSSGRLKALIPGNLYR